MCAVCCVHCVSCCMCVCVRLEDAFWWHVIARRGEGCSDTPHTHALSHCHAPHQLHTHTYSTEGTQCSNKYNNATLTHSTRTSGACGTSVAPAHAEAAEAAVNPIWSLLIPRCAPSADGQCLRTLWLQQGCCVCVRHSQRRKEELCERFYLSRRVTGRESHTR